MVGSSRFVEVELGASSPLNAQQIVPPRCFVESKSEDRRRIGGREEDLDLPTMLSALCLVCFDFDF